MNTTVTKVRKKRAGRRRNNTAPSRSTRESLSSLVHEFPYVEVLDVDGVERIHDASMRILEEVGIEFRDQESLELWRKAGANVQGELVKIDRTMLMDLISDIPSEFDLYARNPDRNLHIGGRHAAMMPSFGPPYIIGLDGERRASLRQDNIDMIKISHMLPAMQIAGMHHCELMDVPVSHRHLVMLSDGLLYSDKVAIGDCATQQRAEDTIALMKIVMGDEFVDNKPVLTGFLNGNSPLVWDESMLGAAKVYARHGQPIFMSPFSLAGANTPASTLGTIAQVSAEALAGCAFMQLINRGAPVVYGMYLSMVDMRSGAPLTGIPELCHLIYVAGQLSRFYGIPLRTVGMHTGSKILDAQAGYESMMVMHASILAGVNLITQCAGWTEHGLTGNLAKYISDGEYCEMFHRYAKGVSFDGFDEAMAAIREVGPGGHFLGTQHTLDNYKTAFFLPEVMDNNNYDTWKEMGSKDTNQRAIERARQMLESYERPPIDQSVEEELNAFLVRRMQEIPAMDRLA